MAKDAPEADGTFPYLYDESPKPPRALNTTGVSDSDFVDIRSKLVYCNGGCAETAFPSRATGADRFFSMVLGVTLLCVCALSSCKTSCDNADASVTTVTDGIRNSTLTVYESAAWDGHYLEFRPQKELVFNHGLRTIPFNITTYVGFSPCPLAKRGVCSDDPEPSAEVAEGAGDLSPISDVNEQSFTIRNNTCETFYLRVTAEADEEGGS